MSNGPDLLARREGGEAIRRISPRVRRRLIELGRIAPQEAHDRQALMGALAAIALSAIEGDVDREACRQRIRQRLRAIIAADGPEIVYQPIIDARTGTLWKVEALSRFRTDPYRPPNEWFADAGEAGMLVEMEIRSIRKAFEGFAPVWSRERVPVAVNASVETIMSGALAPIFEELAADLVVLEVAEQQSVPCYEAFNACLKPIRDRGVRVAVDDIGNGYAGLRHVLSIKPDIVKIDLSLVRDVDKDVLRQAMIGAIIKFGSDSGSMTIAEGVETEDELRTLRAIGIDAIQGYLVGRPCPADDILRNFAGSMAPCPQPA